MRSDEPLASSVEYEVIKVKEGIAVPATVQVATEVPFTIVANDNEIATLMCTPQNLEELAYGFLYTSGIINHKNDVASYDCDDSKWVARLELRDMPELSVLNKRLYTSGCGKGVMYSSIVEISSRHPIRTSFEVDYNALVALMQWLQQSSVLFKKSGGVHTAAVSEGGALPAAGID
ncbi:MAG: formate dehydrogenase accessory sulfurtransferase FdhD, partial [Candidatus Latescibacterota bacterium]